MKYSDKELLGLAINITSKVGEYLKNNFGSLKSMIRKTDYHYAIKEDFQSNDMYENYFSKNTPDFGLYTEEGEKILNKEYTWIVDPIEGTSNYRVGNPFWATQIALLKENVPILSVINAPLLNMFFRSKRNSGSYLNNEKISVSNLRNMNMVLLSIGKGTGRKNLNYYKNIFNSLIENVRTFRNFGATGLELCFTAAGKIDIYLNKGSQIYDFAPGSLIVEEAGGIVTDFSGKKWMIGKNEIIASNKTLNKKVVGLLKNYNINNTKN